MIRKILLTAALMAASFFCVSAYSGPEDLIPKPVEYSVESGFYAPKADGSDVKVYLSSPAFAAKVKDLPDFAKEEAYELVVGKKGIKIYITLLSLLMQGTTLPLFARKLGLSAPMEKTGNDFGVELPDEIDTDLTDLTITPDMLADGDTLKEIVLPDGALVMIVKRGTEFLVPNGSLHLQAGDKLLLISER